MMEIAIRRIDRAHAGDVRLPNEPFSVWGRMVPRLENGCWSFSSVQFAHPAQRCFPDEAYDWQTDDAVFFGAYARERCVGLAVLRTDMSRYLYLDDLKVCGAYRGQGAGGRLVDACLGEAAARGMRGVYTVGQDDNLSACLFYLKQGFAIGGFDNRVYGGTGQEGSANIFFYKDI